ncbi:MAG: DEAD/DEAH box helicase [Bacteroidia bacterium]|nr:DEAD/DEAH box helicase [Bacteroidia bacterium]
MEFKNFGIDPRLLEGIGAIGFEVATPVQEQAIPFILKGRDIIASAQTGTGKTAAFLLPVIHRIITSAQDEFIKALVIVPTRELAVQIDQHLEGLSYYTPVSSIAVYGGGDGCSFEREKKALSEGADVVICTPGRMISHLNMGYVKIAALKYLILDEADRMLDMGFYDDILRIISYLPEKRQTLLFSATMPHKIRDLARKILKFPAEISLDISKPPEKILQIAYVVYDSQKIPLIKHLLKDKLIRSVLIFCSTKINTKKLGRELKQSGLAADAIHSDLDQATREKILLSFKNRKLHILVATDILSRGIDIEDIDLIINFDVPGDGEDYIHRIGRTARAEADGVAITFINEKEQRQFLAIENLLGKTIHKVILPSEFGETPSYEPKKSHYGRGRRTFHKKTGRGKNR